MARPADPHHPGELFVLVLAGITAALAIRNIVWFALAATAVLPARERGETFRTAAAGTAALATVCVIPAALALALTKPAPYWQGTQTSTAAAEVLQPLVAAPGAVLADDHHADWPLWRFRQLRGRLVYDDRLELLTSQQLQTVSAVLGGGAGTLGACLVVVDPARAVHLPGRVLHRDGTTVVLRESSAGCSRPRGRG